MQQLIAKRENTRNRGRNMTGPGAQCPSAFQANGQQHTSKIHSNQPVIHIFTAILEQQRACKSSVMPAYLSYTFFEQSWTWQRACKSCVTPPTFHNPIHILTQFSTRQEPCKSSITQPNCHTRANSSFGLDEEHGLFANCTFHLSGIIWLLYQADQGTCLSQTTHSYTSHTSAMSVLSQTSIINLWITNMTRHNYRCIICIVIGTQVLVSKDDLRSCKLTAVLSQKLIKVSSHQ